MARRLTAWLLIFPVLTVNYSRLFVYAGFKLNQSYIAAKLCENRDKPSMHCNGKCYLVKKIRQAEDKQNNTESQSHKNLYQDAYFINNILSVNALWATGTRNRFLPAINCGKLPGAHISVFRPPQLGLV